jgi:hypothetical protein
MFVRDVYLPVFVAKRRYLDTTFNRIEPLLRGYLFAFFNVADGLFKLRSCEGITEILSPGDEPCEVSRSIIEQIKLRERDGIVALNAAKLHPLRRVRHHGRPFSGNRRSF